MKAFLKNKQQIFKKIHSNSLIYTYILTINKKTTYQTKIFITLTKYSNSFSVLMEKVLIGREEFRYLPKQENILLLHTKC